MNPTLYEYLSVPGYVWLWIAFLLAGSWFVWRMRFLIRIIRLGSPVDRTSDVWPRIRRVLSDVLLHARFRDLLVTPAHLAIFWGFLFFAGSFLVSLLKGLLPFLPIPFPEEWEPIRLALDVFAVLVLVALLVAGFRRVVLRPAALKQSGDAIFILVLIGGLMITSLLGSASSIIAEGYPASAAWQPAGSILAPLLRASGLNGSSAHGLAVGMWWAHMLIVLGFLAYLPSSKHLHLLFAPFGIYFSDFSPKGRIQRDNDASGTADKLTLEDFTWRELLTPFSCAECGRCDRACPSFTGNDRLSPQQLVHKFKEYCLETGHSILSANGKNGDRQLLNDLIDPAEVWACTTCYACMERCVIRNEHLPLVMRMRRFLVANGNVDARIQDTLTSFSRYGNSFAQSERLRPRWTQGLPFKIKDARKEPVEALWFVGDFASFDPRVQSVTQNVARLFAKAGLDVGILFESERNAGNDLRRIGEEGLYEMVVEKNIAALKKCTFGEIITTDPHTYNTLKNEYPDFGGEFRVRHYTEVLADLLRRNVLNVAKSIDGAVTYHDPCYLGRYNGIYDEPREILAAIGARLVEMPRNRADGFCCGAGGGRIWMEDKPGSHDRPSEMRMREAAGLSGVATVVTACPKDIVMFQDALKTTGEQRLRIRDIGDLVLDAVSDPTKEN